MLDVAKAARVYLKIDDVRKERQAAHDEEDQKLKDQQEQIKAHLLKFLNETNQKSSNTADGLVYWEEVVTPTAADWGAFYEWIKEHDAFDFLHKRITATEITAYMEQNEGAIPPGVSVFRQRVVRVRRNSS